MIYLDNAATTFPKPAAVIRAASESVRWDGNPGRGSHRLAMSAAEEVYRCRSAAAKLFGASPERVIFTLNTTYALNMVIKSAHAERGGSILISDLEHNSVYRPAMALGCDVRIFDSALEYEGDERTYAILASAASLADETTKVMVCTAASNIVGASMPIRALGEFCRERGIFFIVDGAQAGGVMPINMADDCIDALCLPGHKGLYGPMGVGMLILGEDVTLPTFIEGGSGVNSLEVTMPELPPERYEAGTLPMSAIAGLRCGIEFVRRLSPAAIDKHESRLARMLKKSLRDQFGDRVTIYAPAHDGGIVLFNFDGMPSEAVAAKLNDREIAVRAGYHCAPLGHRRLESDGGVRVSFGAFNSERDVYELMRALEKIK